MVFSSILITKDDNEISLLKSYCEEYKIRYKANSFITLKGVKSSFSIDTEVVFFGSKNAFDFYLQIHPKKTNKKFACIGEATKLHIESKGFGVDFYGKSAGNPEKVSIDLNNWLCGRSICIIQSKQSNGSIVKHISSSVIQVESIYETILNPLILEEDFEIIVFTSPSNVKGFLTNNKIQDTAQIIAWGKTTEAELMKNNIRATKVLEKSTFEELIKKLKE